MTIAELNRKLQALNVNDIALMAIENSEKPIVEMNRKQLNEGIDSLGASIWSRKPYTFRTQFIKQKKGQPSDRVTLKDTGSFHRGFFVEVGGNQYDVDSNDAKTDELVDKYGSVFGVAPKNRPAIKVRTAKEFGKIFKQKTGLS